jgi:hypothetical protein
MTNAEKVYENVLTRTGEQNPARSLSKCVTCSFERHLEIAGRGKKAHESPTSIAWGGSRKQGAYV